MSIVKLVVMGALMNVACGEVSPVADSGAPCVSVAGTWSLTGQCGDDRCLISQQGCAVTLGCMEAGAMSGTVTDDRLMFGTSGGPLSRSCDVTVVGGDLAGTCVIAGASCAVTGRLSP